MRPGPHATEEGPGLWGSKLRLRAHMHACQQGPHWSRPALSVQLGWPFSRSRVLPRCSCRLWTWHATPCHACPETRPSLAPGGSHHAGEAMTFTTANRAPDRGCMPAAGGRAGCYDCCCCWLTCQGKKCGKQPAHPHPTPSHPLGQGYVCSLGDSLVQEVPCGCDSQHSGQRPGRVGDAQKRRGVLGRKVLVVEG